MSEKIMDIKATRIDSAKRQLKKATKRVTDGNVELIVEGKEFEGELLSSRAVSVPAKQFCFDESELPTTILKDGINEVFYQMDRAVQILRESGIKPDTYVLGEFDQYKRGHPVLVRFELYKRR